MLSGRGARQCNLSPPVKTAVRPYHVGFVKYWALFTAFYVGFVFVVMHIMDFATCAAVGFVDKNKRTLKLEQSDETSETLIKGTETRGLKEPLAANADSAARFSGQVIAKGATGCGAQKHSELEKLSAREQAEVFLSGYFWITMTLIVILAVFMTLAAMEDMIPKTAVASLGPVILPDPSDGLNPYLTEENARLNLTLCKTAKLSFYVGFADSCEQLGYPYNGLLAPFKLGPTKSTSFFAAWSVRVGLLSVYATFFWVIFLSITGVALLLLSLLGVLKPQRLREVAFAVHGELPKSLRRPRMHGRSRDLEKRTPCFRKQRPLLRTLFVSSRVVKSRLGFWSSNGI